MLINRGLNLLHFENKSFGSITIDVWKKSMLHPSVSEENVT